MIIYKIYIGIVFFSALTMSIAILQDFTKNVVALMKASKDDKIFRDVLEGTLISSWKICMTTFMWALFVVLNLLNI